MNQSEGQKYTAREACTNLALIADHLKDYMEGSSTVGFCLECLGKHFSSLRGLAAEGQDFFPADRNLWLRLRQWCDKTMDDLTDGDITETMIVLVMGDSRRFRKTLQSKYFGKLGTCGTDGRKACSHVIGSSDGECRCLTGFEPCCG